MKAGCAAQKLQFEAHGKRDVVADFDGGRMTSEGGGLLLREANCCLGDLMAWLGQCVSDFRQQGSVEHTATDLIAQRVCALALGYEDLNDHGTLRRDRRPDARPAGRPFLSWLLPGALLSAAVHFLRAPRAVRAAANGGPGRLRRQRWPGVILLRSRTTLVDQERARQYRLFQCPVAMVAGTPRSFGSQVFI